jgi:hypothetical protein
LQITDWLILCVNSIYLSVPHLPHSITVSLKSPSLPKLT